MAVKWLVEYTAEIDAESSAPANDNIAISMPSFSGILLMLGVRQTRRHSVTRLGDYRHRGYAVQSPPS